MAKYSYELKRKIVEEYLNGHAGHKILAKKYQIGVSQIERWVNNYKHFGDEGLMRSRNKREYSVEFKLEAITRYETSEYSYQQLALELGLTNPSIIANWRRQYREEGMEGLRSHKRGRPVTKKDDRNQAPNPSKSSEDLDASTRESHQRIRSRERNTYHSKDVLGTAKEFGKGRSNEQKARIVAKLREQFQLRKILALIYVLAEKVERSR